jgi:hypothetical protein
MESHVRHSDSHEPSMLSVAPLTRDLFNAVNMLAPLYHNGDYNLQNVLLILSVYSWPGVMDQ